MKIKNDKCATWYRSPWGLVILVVLAVAFGGHIALGGNPLMIVGTGLMLFAHLTLAIMSWRAEKISRTEHGS